MVFQPTGWLEKLANENPDPFPTHIERMLPFDQTMSAFPSPLKSPIAEMEKLVGAANAGDDFSTTAPFMSQYARLPVDELRQSRSALPAGGQWRCLWLAKVSDVQLRDGPWHEGDRHSQPQGCVEKVDLDVNPSSPYNPKRRL